MALEEAINGIRTWLEFEKFCECNKGIKLLDYIETVLQELDNLQKENERYKRIKPVSIDGEYEIDIEEFLNVSDKLYELERNSISKDKLIEVIDFAINATDSTDDYSIGLCNGMIYVKALLTDGNPDYKKCQNNKEEKTYEFGLIVGTKREREYWENKIREKIEEINKGEENLMYKNNIIYTLQELLKEE